MKFVVLIMLLLSFQSLSAQPKDEDIIGIWIFTRQNSDQHKAVFRFRADHTVNNTNYSWKLEEDILKIFYQEKPSIAGIFEKKNKLVSKKINNFNKFWRDWKGEKIDKNPNTFVNLFQVCGKNDKWDCQNVGAGDFCRRSVPWYQTTSRTPEICVKQCQELVETRKKQGRIENCIADIKKVKLKVIAASGMADDEKRQTQSTLISPEKSSITDKKDSVSNSRVSEKPITVQHELVPAYLKNPAKGHLNKIPIVLIRYLPTVDGINLDVSKAPDYWKLNTISLEKALKDIRLAEIREKFVREEGSKFHGYKNPNAIPSIGYEVVDILNIYDQVPISTIPIRTAKGFPVFRTDDKKIFKSLGLRSYVEKQGVKEFWIWFGHVEPNFPSYDPKIHKPENFLEFRETNMSSPFTGDISNSERSNDDLPIYSSTFVVYQLNIRRATTSPVYGHNFTHQIERMLPFAESGYKWGKSTLFWEKFVGKTANRYTTGRCGWTHMPPNTLVSYDVKNTNEVDSDCENWRPDGTGFKKKISMKTWSGINYPWPDNKSFDGVIAAQWLIYWMQNIPGYDNRIPHGVNELTNWWEIIGDWDRAFHSKSGLTRNKSQLLKK